ncbi:OmpA family protein, partial [Vibrio sp. 10N.261.48.A2]
ITSRVAAVGFSSSRLVKVDGLEDPEKSRRVSFRAITNADIQIKQILGEN